MPDLVPDPRIAATVAVLVAALVASAAHVLRARRPRPAPARKGPASA
jgi:hypothetical protein